MIGERGFRGGLNLGIGRIESTVANVLAHGGVIQPGILQHHAELRAHVFAREFAHIVAADANGAAIHIVETHKQLHHGGLACSRGTDKRHGLPLAHARREIADHRMLEVVAKAHMVELHVA